jgi:hypothetical protein
VVRQHSNLPIGDDKGLSPEKQCCASQFCGVRPLQPGEAAGTGTVYASRRMTLRLLGLLEVVGAGGPIVLGASHRRKALAALVLVPYRGDAV